MKYFILFLLPIVSQARDVELIVNPANGVQKIEVVGETGKYNGETIWDTRVDGPIPKDAPIGYAERYEVEEEICIKTGPNPRVCEQWSEEKRKVPKLRENAALKAAFEKLQSDKEKEESDKANLKAALKAIKAKLDSDVAPTAAEQRKILKVLAEQCLKLN